MNCSRKRRRAASTRRRASTGDPRQAATASVSAAASSGGIRRASSGVSTSRTAGRSLATIGISSAIASSNVLPRPSHRDGNANTSAAPSRSATSSRYPSTRTLDVRPAPSICAAPRLALRPGPPGEQDREAGPPLHEARRRVHQGVVPLLPFLASDREHDRHIVGEAESSAGLVATDLGAATQHHRVPTSGDDVDATSGDAQASGHDVGDVARDRVEPHGEAGGDRVGRLRGPELPCRDAGRGHLGVPVGHVDQAADDRGPCEPGADAAGLVGFEERRVHEVRTQGAGEAGDSHDGPGAPARSCERVDLGASRAELPGERPWSLPEVRHVQLEALGDQRGRHGGEGLLGAAARIQAVDDGEHAHGS